MASLACAHPGERLGDVAQRFSTWAADDGAASEHFTLGVQGVGISDDPDYVLRQEDVLFADWGCTYRHLYSDTGTTFALRELNSELQRK